MKQEGDKIEIKVGKTDQSMFSNRGASVDLQVPEGTVLDVRTTNGKVNVVAVTGNVKARSSNGAPLNAAPRGSACIASWTTAAVRSVLLSSTMMISWM